MVCSFYLYSTSFVVIGLEPKLSEVGGGLDYRHWNAIIKTELRMIISNSTLTVWPLDKDLNSSVMKISQTNAWILANDLANECMVIWFLDLICLASITWWFDSWTYLVWWALPRTRDQNDILSTGGDVWQKCCYDICYYCNPGDKTTQILLACRKIHQECDDNISAR